MLPLLESPISNIKGSWTKVAWNMFLDACGALWGFLGNLANFCGWAFDRRRSYPLPSDLRTTVFTLTNDLLFSPSLQLSDNEKASFDHLLHALRCGAPPHGGIALGECCFFTSPIDGIFFT